MLNDFLVCPDNCDEEFVFGALPENQDCTDYEMELAEISDVYFIPDGAHDIFAAWATTPTYVANSIDNTATDNTQARRLTVIGTLPAPESENTLYPKGKSKTTKKTFTLEARYFQLAGGGYEFCQKLECGSTAFKFYFADRAGFVYGKAGGIVPSKVDAEFVKGEGDAKNSYLIRITFEGDATPQRRINPITI